MKIVSLINCLPRYSQMAVLYPLLGSLNSSLINAATRIVAQDANNLDKAAAAATSGATAVPISIDKYNEYLNELAVQKFDKDWADQNAPEPPVQVDQLALIEQIHTVRKPLLAMFNAAQASLPNRNGEPADFSIEESLARQLARDYDSQARALEAEEEALIASGVTTREEMNEVDKERFETQQNFISEFKFMIRDIINDAEPASVDDNEADEAFVEMNEEMQHRLIRRILPKLQQSKRQNLGRRTFDEEATNNVYIIGKVIEEFKAYVGESESDTKVKAIDALLGKTTV